MRGRDVLANAHDVTQLGGASNKPVMPLILSEAEETSGQASSERTKKTIIPTRKARSRAACGGGICFSQAAGAQELAGKIS